MKVGLPTFMLKNQRFLKPCTTDNPAPIARIAVIRPGADLGVVVTGTGVTCVVITVVLVVGTDV